MARRFDKLDASLLNLVQADNLATADVLSELVPLSASAITRRLRRLRADGLIARDVAIISRDIAGLRLHAHIHIQLREHAPEAGLAALLGALTSTHEVQYCTEVSGAFDIFVVVVVRDMPAYNAFADAVLANDPVVRRYETSFVKKEVKIQPYIRLDERDIPL